jgi:hypothetical protein
MPSGAWSGRHEPARARFFWDAYEFDIETRMEDEGRPDLRKLVNIREYTEGQVRSRAASR